MQGQLDEVKRFAQLTLDRPNLGNRLHANNLLSRLYAKSDVTHALYYAQRAEQITTYDLEGSHPNWPTLRLSALILLGSAYTTVNRFEEAEASFQEGLPLVEQSDIIPQKASFWLYYGLLKRYREDFHTAQQHLQRAEQFAEQAGVRFLLAHTLLEQGICLGSMQQFESAIDYFQRSRGMYWQLDNPNFCRAHQRAIVMLIQLGEHVAAASEMAELRKNYNAATLPSFQVTYHAMEIWIASLQENTSQAEDHLSRMESVTIDPGNIAHDFPLLEHLAQLNLPQNMKTRLQDLIKMWRTAYASNNERASSNVSDVAARSHSDND